MAERREARPWAVSTVRLRRVGGENDPLAVAVVSVRVGERWIDVISELVGNNFDHYAEVCNWAHVGPSDSTEQSDA